MEEVEVEEVTEPVSSVARRATCLENVLKEVVAVVEVQEHALSVVKKVTCLENAQILTLVPDVAVEEEVVVAVNATNAIKKVTWQENAQMEMVVAWTKVPTRDRKEMTATQVLMTVATGAAEMPEPMLADGTQQVQVHPVAGAERTLLISLFVCKMQLINLIR